ncbi:MAG: hypothetical protein ACRD0K_16865 [Egibacteraceae bacterium]
MPLQQLEQVGKPAIKAFYGTLADRPLERGEGVLSPKTVHKHPPDAVQDARRRRRGPTHRPQPRSRSAQTAGGAGDETWTPAQMNRFLERIAQGRQRLYALWRLAATTGLPRGE